MVNFQKENVKGLRNLPPSLAQDQSFPSSGEGRKPIGSNGVNHWVQMPALSLIRGRSWGKLSNLLELYKMRD